MKRVKNRDKQLSLMAGDFDDLQFLNNQIEHMQIEEEKEEDNLPSSNRENRKEEESNDQKDA